MVFIRWYK